MAFSIRHKSNLLAPYMEISSPSLLVWFNITFHLSDNRLVPIYYFPRDLYSLEIIAKWQSNKIYRSVEWLLSSPWPKTDDAKVDIIIRESKLCTSLKVIFKKSDIPIYSSEFAYLNETLFLAPTTVTTAEVLLSGKGAAFPYVAVVFIGIVIIVLMCIACVIIFMFITRF